MSKSILDRIKTHMPEGAAAQLYSICTGTSLGTTGLPFYVNLLLDALDARDAVIDQRNREITNLHDDATKLRAGLSYSDERNREKQKQITGLSREVAALKHDLEARTNDDKRKADVQGVLNWAVSAVMPVAVASEKISPFPEDFYARVDGKIVGIDAKYVILNTAPVGAMLTEAVVSQAEISVLDKTIHNKVCAALETATQPGGVIFAALNK